MINFEVLYIFVQPQIPWITLRLRINMNLMKIHI